MSKVSKMVKGRAVPTECQPLGQKKLRNLIISHTELGGKEEEKGIPNQTDNR